MGPSQTWKSGVKAQHKDCFCNIILISGSMPDVHVGVDRTSVPTVISMLIFYIYIIIQQCIYIGDLDMHVRPQIAKGI